MAQNWRMRISKPVGFGHEMIWVSKSSPLMGEIMDVDSIRNQLHIYDITTVHIYIEKWQIW